MRVFRKFRASDGRIKIATLSGVSALVAVIAMLVGVLPVFATSGNEVDTTDEGVHPEEVQYGGGAGACDFVEVDSDARFELHINNPANDVFEAPDGTEVKITLDEEQPRIFDYEFLGQGDDPAVMAAYDVVVNGGPHNLWYDNDGQVGPLQRDGNLHAPRKNNDDLNNLSHINICYDFAPVSFVCGTSEELEGEGLITHVSAVIFENSVEGTFDCSNSKDAFYFLDNDVVTLDFGDDEEEADVAGRLDFTKVFLDEDGDPDPDSFEPLEYDGSDNFTGFDDVEWCETRPFKDGDGTEFSDWLPTGTENGSYPLLPNGESACKVAEDEDVSGTQVTVLYFEFEDPQFR